MLFLGIDFGWQSKPSGVAALAWNGRALRLTALGRETTPADVLAWVDRQTRQKCAMIAVDAPLVIPNATGMREADRLMHRHFGSFHAGCYPANLGRPFAPRTAALTRALEEREFAHADSIQARQPGRYQIEVHPHAASVQLFDLPRILKYKKGPLAQRRRQLARFRSLLATSLPLLRPHLLPTALPPIPATGPALKDVEDRLDALLCAYIGAHWWYWGAQRNTVFGNRRDGYIVVPATAPSRAPRAATREA